MNTKHEHNPEPPTGYRRITEEEKDQPLPDDAMIWNATHKNWVESCLRNCLVGIHSRNIYATRITPDAGKAEAEENPATVGGLKGPGFRFYEGPFRVQGDNPPMVVAKDGEALLSMMWPVHDQTPEGERAAVNHVVEIATQIAKGLNEKAEAAEAETETPDEYDRLKARKDGIVARDEERLRDEGRKSVILIRCTECLNVPQQNKAEFTGAECGGCIAKERDAALAEVERVKVENTKTRELYLNGLKERVKLAIELTDHVPAADLINDLRAQLATERAAREQAESREHQLRDALERVLKSAYPNPTEHPGMFKAWDMAKKALTTPPSTTIADLRLKLETAERERDAAVKDTKRLDWLETKRWGICNHLNDDAERCWMAWDNDAGDDDGITSHPTLRAAIDAALAPEETK